QAEKLARSAASETEQVREELETERRLYHAAEEKLSEITRVKEQIEHNLGAVGEQAAARERELLAKIHGLTDTLDAERDTHAEANDELARLVREREVSDQQLKATIEERVAEAAHRNERIAALEGDLKIALDRQRSLEEQLRAAEREQAEKEAAMLTLAREIEQATAALDAEKEERQVAQEAYAEAKDALVALRKKPQIPSTAIEEIPIREHAIVTKHPDLPATIRGGAHALTRKESDRVVPVPPEPLDPGTAEMESPHVRIRTVEDLFEDPRELGADELSDAIRSTMPPAEGDEIPHAPEDDLSPSDYTGQEETAEINGDEEPGDEDADEDESGFSPGGATGDTAQGEGAPTFSRQQWFELVKWAHNTETLSHDERIRIVKLGRLIQKGRVLTRRQEAQLAELMLLARAKGYRPRE